MTKNFMCFITVTLSLFFSIVGVSSLYAQQEEFTLEEITVTAEKRSENLQKVAMSVAVIKGEEVMNQGAVTIQDILKNIPNVSTSDAGGGNGFTVNIRGLGMDLPVGVGESSVSINTDGAYQGNNEVMGMFGFFDIDQVEVLRGPQGTLYGRNATGGVVNITSKKPTTEKVEGYVSLEVAEFRKMKQEAAINIPVSGTIAGRLSLVNSKQVAFTYDSNNYRDNQNGLATRFQLGYMPGNDISINFIYSYTQRSGGLWSDVLKTDWDAGRYYLNTNVYPYDTTRKMDSYNSSFSVTAEFPMGPGIVTVIPSYQKNKGRSFNFGVSPFNPSGEATFTAGYRPWKDTSEIIDLRYASKSDSRIKWTTGLYWTKSDRPQYPTATQPDANRWASSAAVLGQATYPFTDTFRGILGTRYTVDEKGYDDIDKEGGRGAGPVTLSSNSFEFKYVDWKLGIELDFSQDVMGYFTLASGHKPGGYNEMGDWGSFDTESAVSGELGLKSRLLNKRLQLNGDVFYYQYSGYQVVDAYSWFNPETNLYEFKIDFFNADKVMNMGAEVDATAILGKATGLDFSISYLKNEYIDDFYMHPVPNGPAVNYKGETMPHSPEFNIKASIDHTFYFGDGSTLRPSVSYRWTDEQYTGVQPLEEFLVPSYGVADFAMNYTSAKGWYLNFYANNALDNNYITGSTNMGGSTKYFVGSPRLMGLILNIRF